MGTPSFLRSRSGIKFEKKTKSFKTLIIVSSLLLISSIFCLFGVHIYRYVQIKPSFSLQDNGVDRYLIKREAVLSTLIVLEGTADQKIEGVWYCIINEKTGSTFIYYVPPGVYMKDYSNKVDEYVSVSDLRYAGNIISQEKDIEYAIWQLNNLTGITIDSYIWLKPESLLPFANLFGDVSEFTRDKFVGKYSNQSEVTLPAMMISSIVSKFSTYKSVVNIDEYKNLMVGVDTSFTNLGMIQRIKQIDSALSAGNVYMIDLAQPWATVQMPLGIGRSVSMINYPQVDKKLTNVLTILKGREIEKEQVKVEVYNGSKIEGLASRYYRKLRNAGLEVVRYENAPNEIERTQIYIPKQEKYPQSFSLVKKLIVVDAQEINSRPDFMTTGDIVIILGKDMETEAFWK